MGGRFAFCPHSQDSRHSRTLWPLFAQDLLVRELHEWTRRGARREASSPSVRIPGVRVIRGPSGPCSDRALLSANRTNGREGVQDGRPVRLLSAFPGFASFADPPALVRTGHSCPRIARTDAKECKTVGRFAFCPHSQDSRHSRTLRPLFAQDLLVRELHEWTRRSPRREAGSPSVRIPRIRAISGPSGPCSDRTFLSANCTNGREGVQDGRPVRLLTAFPGFASFVDPPALVRTGPPCPRIARMDAKESKTVGRFAFCPHSPDSRHSRTLWPLFAQGTLVRELREWTRRGARR